jgi:hypothetical protein
MADTEEVKTETPQAWAKVTKSSSKDGGIGYEYGYSDPTGNVHHVLASLTDLKVGVERLVINA